VAGSGPERGRSRNEFRNGPRQKSLDQITAIHGVDPLPEVGWSMIRKSGSAFSEEIMLKKDNAWGLMQLSWTSDAYAHVIRATTETAYSNPCGETA